MKTINYGEPHEVQIRLTWAHKLRLIFGMRLWYVMTATEGETGNTRIEINHELRS